MLSVKIKSEMLDSYSEVNILSGTGVNEKYFVNCTDLKKLDK